MEALNFQTLCEQFENLNINDEKDIDFLCSQFSNLNLKDTKILELLKELLIKFLFK